ncbi:alpha/beta fold hydrolase [Thiolinea disciformis]|uniref:alpha/beta fold hydrolase n=1 Tax=Thiolinea disciformis TaxID=125614 RepID=UPI00037B2EB8|nr:alpha/beta hydrolase [Thiolinea disciformis]
MQQPLSKWHRQIMAAMAMSLALVSTSKGFAAESCEDVDQGKCTLELSTGIKMAYVEAGKPDGETVFLLHGLTDSSRSWSLVMRTLREMQPDWHIIALDQRGHGASSLPPAEKCAEKPETCYKMSDFADDIVAFMQAKNIAKAHFVGHSMGSFITQEMALAHPDKVNKVVLVATSNKGLDNPVLRDYVLKEPVEGAWKKALDEKKITQPEAIYNASPSDADPNIEAWLANSWDVDVIADPKLVAAIVKETAHVKLGTWMGATKALLGQDNTERLKNLTIPALVLWGTQDAIFYNDPDQTGIKAALTEAAKAGKTNYFWKQYGTIPLPASGSQENDIGHNIQWEAPKEIAKDIVSFIQTGKPTLDLYRSDPQHLQTIVTESGKAELLPAQ